MDYLIPLLLHGLFTSGQSLPGGIAGLAGSEQRFDGTYNRTVPLSCCKALQLINATHSPSLPLTEVVVQVTEHDGNIYILSAAKGSLNGGVGGNYGLVTKLDGRGTLQWRVMTEASHMPKAMVFTGTEIEVVGERFLDGNTQGPSNYARSFVFRVRLNDGGTFARSDYTGAKILGAALGGPFNSGGKTLIVGEDTDALGVYTFYENIGGAGNGQQKQSFPVRLPGDNSPFIFESAAEVSGRGIFLVGRANDRGALIVVQGTGHRKYTFDQGTRLFRVAKIGNGLLLVVGEQNDDPKIWLLNSAYKIIESYSLPKSAVSRLGNIVVRQSDDFDNIYVSSTTSNNIPAILSLTINHRSTPDGEYIDRSATKHFTVSTTNGTTSSPPQITLSEKKDHIIYATDRYFNVGSGQYPGVETDNSNWLQVGRLSFDLKQSCLSPIDPIVTYMTGVNQQLYGESITAGAGDNHLIYKEGFAAFEEPEDATTLSYCGPTYIDCYRQKCPGETDGRFIIAWPSTCPPTGGQSIFARVTDSFGRTVATREGVPPNQPINFDLSDRPSGRYFIEVACGTPGQPGRVLFTSTVVVITV